MLRDGFEYKTQAGINENDLWIRSAKYLSRHNGSGRLSNCYGIAERRIMKNEKLNEVTFLKLGKYGRFGNQMFQIAATIGVAKKYGAEYLFWRWPYNKYFENPVRTNPFIKFRKWRKYREPKYSYNEIPYVSGALSIAGFFQSEKYFKHCENEIRHHFTLKNKWVKYIRKKYPHLNENTCSIHVRRGDYLKELENHEDLRVHPIQPVSYFEKAAKELYGEGIKNIHFIICSDDIEWCKKNFEFPTMTFVEGEKDVVDMFIMSMCQDNIIVNSSFSWWAAWLNKNENRVVAPKLWFGREVKMDAKDVYAEGWMRI
jgi:hypothetical protein